MNIIESLNVIRKGKLVVEAQEKLQQLVKACSETGKKGKLVITLNVGAAEEQTVAITGRVKIDAPEATTSSTMFYTDESGALFREDPRQPELPSITRMDDAVSQ